MASSSTARAALIAALHGARLEPYLIAAGGNSKNALALYRWNIQLAAALQELLSVAEVVLRNSIDAQLQHWNDNELGHAGSWLLADPAAPLKGLTQGKRTQAIDHANTVAGKRQTDHWRYGHTVTHNDVLAQVMFGLWKDILPNHVPDAGDKTTNKNRERMWDEAVRLAFPNIVDLAGDRTFWRVYRLHGLRNRVSHMEPLLEVDTRERTRDIFDLVQSISKPTHDWLTGLNRVPTVVASRPC